MQVDLCFESVGVQEQEGSVTVVHGFSEATPRILCIVLVQLSNERYVSVPKEIYQGNSWNEKVALPARLDLYLYFWSLEK